MKYNHFKGDDYMEWKDVQGYEGMYRISSCGNLMTVKNGKEKIIDISDMAFEKANDKEKFVADLKSKIENLR